MDKYDQHHMNSVAPVNNRDIENNSSWNGSMEDEELREISNAEKWTCVIPLWLHPLAMSFSIPFSCVISYILYLDAIDDLQNPPSHKDEFPFISDTGIYPPASSWFTFLFTFVGFFIFTSSVVRYQQLDTGCGRHGRRRCAARLNKLTLAAGCLSALGVIIVASFQYTNSLAIHLCGAALAFGVGVIFTLMQTILSFLLPNLPGNTLPWRITKVVLNVFHICVTIPFLYYSFDFYWNDHHQQREKAAITEWVLAISLSLYPLTVIPEVRHFALRTNMRRTHELGSLTCCILRPPIPPAKE